MHEYLQHRWHLYGKQWNGISSILPMQYITPDRCTDPCMSERVPNTFLDSQLHLMHRNYLTWFNGASPTGGAHWLTIWCSNDLRARQSLGCLAPPSGCLRDLFSLISSLSIVTLPGRWNRKEVVCYGKNKGTLDGNLQEFRGLDSSHLAQVAILVQTITSEFLKWTGRCCLYPFAAEWYSSCWLGTVSLTINLSVLQPKNPRKCWGLPGFFSRCEVGDFECTLPWGS